MKKYKIFYIDDQSYALPQLIRAIPEHIDYELTFVQRVEDIVSTDYDVVILDYYLDKDNVTSLSIIEKFAGSYIISFSSCPDKNIFMLEHGAMYGINKLKKTNSNSELNKVMKNIFTRD